MTREAEIVAIARRWLGTPYRHQASALGAGCDCLGLVSGIWRELYGAMPEAAPDYSPDWGEYGEEELLLAAAGRHLRPVAQARPGDVVLFRMRRGVMAKHLGVVSALGARAAFIHAYERHGVVESPFSEPWRRRVAAQFRFP